MCNSNIANTLNAGALGLGAITKSVGAYNASSASKQSAAYQASVAQNNAIVAQDQATAAENVGQQQVQDQGLKNAQTYGMQRANLAANGVDLGEGSANDILTSTKMMGNRDAATIQDNALRQAWGYQVQAADYQSNATAMGNISRSINPTNAAMTSLVGSAPLVSNAWRTYNTANNGPTSAIY